MSESDAGAKSSRAIEPTNVYTPSEGAAADAPDLSPPSPEPAPPPVLAGEVVSSSEGGEGPPQGGEAGPQGGAEGGDGPDGEAIQTGTPESGAEDAAEPDGKEVEAGHPEGGEDLPVLHSGRIVDVIADAMTFLLVIARLAVAAVAMRMLSQAVKGAYSYVEDCAKTVDGLADLAGALAVDDMVTSSHHDAAATMRGSLALADALASEAAEMATEFDNAARDHEADYGDVNEAMQKGDYDVAEREWYSNR
ncbi:hypothetical protein [Streptomyces sp. NPDC002287]